MIVKGKEDVVVLTSVLILYIFLLGKKEGVGSMLELFRILKIEYPLYLILFKSGSFYVSFDEDAVILNKLFNYKLNEMKNNIKAGFPLSNIEKIRKYLEDKKINYLIIEDKKIVYKDVNKKNKFKSYVSNVYNIISIKNRINNISKILNERSNDNDIEKILDKIEGIINE